MRNMISFIVRHVLMLVAQLTDLFLHILFISVINLQPLVEHADEERLHFGHLAFQLLLVGRQ